MADLGRQLQEYLAQAKAGGGGGSGSSAAPDGCAGAEAAAAAGGGGPAGGGWPWAAEADPWLPGLSRWQRLAGGGLCLLLAALCWALAALYAPLLLLRARKFALLWSLGSVCGLGAAALLRGPRRLLREPGGATLLYLAALGGTLYAALARRSAALAALGAAAQLGAAAAALPGGAAGLRLLGRLLGPALRRRAAAALPV
ncbi:vesicle transport protein SFT2C [Apteryx mantelli]|uniref:Vesicle transport protein n=1 Tax=Apteryx mantelli TaxID=2696672 RepID=A0ABM4EZH7_9AVES